MSQSSPTRSESYLTFDSTDDPDNASITTSGSTIITQSSESSSLSSVTQWGPGTFSGKGIMAVGEAMLNGIENIVIRRRLRAIAKCFPHRDDALIPEDIYLDLVELSRASMYSDTIRGIALGIIVVQIASKQTSQLVQAIIRWPSKEIRLMMLDLMLSLYPSLTRSASKPRRMHEILGDLFRTRVLRDSDDPCPFELFANQIAMHSPEGVPPRAVLALTTSYARVPTIRLCILKEHSKSVHSVASSQNTMQFVTASDDSTIRIWDVSKCKVVGDPLYIRDSLIMSMALSPDGCDVASSHLAYYTFQEFSIDPIPATWIRIWSLSTGRPVRDLSIQRAEWIYTLAYSRDGGRVASGSGDGTFQIWDVDTGYVAVKPRKWHEGGVYSVAFSPDGRYIASGSNDTTIYICDAMDGLTVTGPLRRHKTAVWSVAYSFDGRYLASASFDALYVWDLNSKATMTKYSPFPDAPRCLLGHNNNISSVAFSSDGQFLISGGSDGTICVWHISSRTWEIAITLRTLNSTDRMVCALAISTDMNYIIAGTEGGAIYVWGRYILGG